MIMQEKEFCLYILQHLPLLAIRLADTHRNPFDFAEALEDLQTLTFTDSRRDVVNVLHMCGVCKGKLGEQQEALVDLHQALGRDRFCVTGLTLFDFEGALAGENWALQVDPQNAPSLTSRGLKGSYGKGDQGDWAGAVADLNETEQLQPLNDHSLEQ